MALVVDLGGNKTMGFVLKIDMCEKINHKKGER